MANIKARRLLSDLFTEGVEIRFYKDPKTGKPVGKIGPFVNEHGRRVEAGKPFIRQDEDGKDTLIETGEDVVAMFVRPPDPVQRDMAIRSSQGKRAAALVRAKRNEESEEHLTIMAFLADMSDDTLVEYVVVADTANRQEEAEREVLGLDEWKDMTAYQDAIRGFLDMEQEELEGNEEYEAMMDLDSKYNKQVTEREIQLADAHRESLGFLQREQVERKALERRAEIVGSQAFMAEYEKQMLFYAVREVDKPETLFFDKPEELASQPDYVRDLINDALEPFITEASEAKNSQRAASGSVSSELPVTPVTSESSTPEEPTD